MEEKYVKSKCGGSRLELKIEKDVKFLNQNLTRCKIFTQNLTRCKIFKSKSDAL